MATQAKRAGAIGDIGAVQIKKLSCHRQLSPKKTDNLKEGAFLQQPPLQDITSDCVESSNLHCSPWDGVVYDST